MSWGGSPSSRGRQHYEEGWRFQQGIGMPKDPVQAVAWYRKSAEDGDEVGQYALGQCFEHGIGVEKSLTDAFACYSLSAEQGYARAQRSLGKLYENGWGVNKNFSLASLWYQRSAEQGDSEGEYCYGRCYENGWGVEKDVSKAYKWFRRSANQNDPWGWVHMGRCHESGWGVDKNLSEAFKCYKVSAEAGNVLGQRHLARCYEKGWGTESNLVLAYEWCLKSAEQGNSSAQVALGWFYTNGLGVEKDVRQAFSWYMRSAELGDASGENNVGKCYEWGLGVEKNLDLAYKYYKQSAEKADSWGQYNMGRCYEKGWGVERDRKEAARWYRTSGEQGVAPAQHNLGWCYEHGWGVEKNLVQARAWYRKSAEQGYAKASEALQKLLASGGGSVEPEVVEQRARDVRGLVVRRSVGGGEEVEKLKEENARMKREWAEDRNELEGLRQDYGRLLEQDKERKKGYARLLEQEDVRREEHELLLAQVEEREAEVLRERLAFQEEKKKLSADLAEKERAAEARKVEHETQVKELKVRIKELEESIKVIEARAKAPVPEAKAIAEARALESKRRNSMSMSAMELEGLRGKDIVGVMKRLREKEEEADLMQMEVVRLKTAWEEDAKELKELRDKYGTLQEQEHERKAGFARVLQQEDMRQEEHKQRLIEIERREVELAKELEKLEEAKKEVAVELEKLEEGKKKLSSMLEEMENAAWAQREKHETMVEELQARVLELEEETARKDQESDESIQLQQMWREEEKKRDVKKMKDLETLRVKEHAGLVERLKESEKEVAKLKEALERLQGEVGKRKAAGGMNGEEREADVSKVEVDKFVAERLPDADGALGHKDEDGRRGNGGEEAVAASVVNEGVKEDQEKAVERAVSADKVGRPQDKVEELGDGHAMSSTKEVKAPIDGIFEVSSLKYGEEDKVGVDCFGEVFHGMWGDSRVTIKKLRHQEGMTQRQLTAFKGDIKVLTALNHPHIVKLLGACVTRRHLAIVTERVDGGTLWDVLHMREDPPAWSMEEKVRMIMGMASGVVYLHSRGIVHRDLNSTNLLVDANKVIKVADAGLSKTRNAMLLGASPQERHKYGVGSPLWSAPEVLEGKILDAQGWEKADMYSFAVVCSELVAMETPFGDGGEEWTLEQMKTLVQKGKRPSLGGDTPVFLKELLQVAWHSEPRKRPSFGDFLSRLCGAASDSSFFKSLKTSLGIPSANSCVMCLNADAVAMLTPCWHACICNEDFANLQKVAEPRCPVCRTIVEGALQRSFSISSVPNISIPNMPEAPDAVVLPPTPTDLLSIPPADLFSIRPADYDRS